MTKHHVPDPTVLIIFGAGGDLTWRKLIPALYHLQRDEWLDERFAVLCIDRKPLTIEEYHDAIFKGAQKSSRSGPITQENWERFAAHIFRRQGDLTAPQVYQEIKQFCDEKAGEWKTKVQRVFYLAVAPTLIQPICDQLAAAGFQNDREGTRIVIEKPFGRDLESARALNRMVTRDFEESQVYRIDHYLGKETVQNILAFRFANSLFEPVWNRRYIDHVQLTVGEDIGVEHRGGYYEQAGALRDMLQNHLLQLLGLVAMEPLLSFDADEIRNKKVDALKAIRPVTADEVDKYFIRGQYGSGWFRGEKVPGYRAEANVSPQSNIETFVAGKFFLDNWRWQDVPFYFRTGKRLPARVSEVVLRFRPVPHLSFPATAVRDLRPNLLTIRIQPDEGITLRFQAKQPGQMLRLKPVEMHFDYSEAFSGEQPEAYETLLLDAMQGDAGLFMRADQVETAWKLVDPILENWESAPPDDFPNYAAGTWGPEAATMLLANDGRHWTEPRTRDDTPTPKTESP
ncbi:MAG: glucose-6-phosphate dehydrogenase [Gemmataceae bacterium]|nr:glucose-6-phosphate dehydrogenase [Gemmataceae bacterium]